MTADVWSTSPRSLRELPLKRKAPPPKGSPPETRVIKNDDSYSSSAAEAVTSSGYQSPSGAGGGVISLDSPSPPAPASPQPPAPEPASNERSHLTITPIDSSQTDQAAQQLNSNRPTEPQHTSVRARQPIR
ncbi:Suppressor of variegation 2-10 [Operophtera brumata]|uniref:Suppressor of variegation 2-10 n=1 Tax=Operophtera brumata TaxID=104452 RepID=A0A0L7LL55_OPEBR|nr:Suppressor of variegation 2-10 [Operophtera brumata]